MKVAGQFKGRLAQIRTREHSPVRRRTREVRQSGEDVKVVLEPSSPIKSSLLQARIIVKGKSRPLNAAFRNSGKAIIMTFDVNRKPGTYRILIGQRLQGEFAVLGETKLIVRKGRRIRP